MAEPMLMQIYTLENLNPTIDSEFKYAVCIAQSEKEARQIVNQAHGTEGPIWTEDYRVEAKSIGQAYDDVLAGLLKII